MIAVVGCDLGCMQWDTDRMQEREGSQIKLESFSAAIYDTVYRGHMADDITFPNDRFVMFDVSLLRIKMKVQRNAGGRRES